MTRREGFALTEMLVAVGIGALIVTGLIYLHVDFVGWTAKALRLGQPTGADGGLIRQARALDRCAQPGAVLEIDGGALVARIGDSAAPVLALPSESQARIVTAAAEDGTARPGRSMASLSRGEGTLAVVALRCDLAEVCAYNPQEDRCAR